MPHSRWNEIPEAALLACGYRVLTRSKDAGVDACVKQRRSLFVFLQGHPEYDAMTLLLEFRRDVGRFLRRERETYPTMPHGYFDRETVEALTALRERALVDRREGLLADFPTAMAAGKVTNTWRPTAENLYRNWIAYLRGRNQAAHAGAQRLTTGDRGAFPADSVTGVAGVDTNRSVADVVRANGRNRHSVGNSPRLDHLDPGDARGELAVPAQRPSRAR
jgi:hypothetical protein